MRQRMMSFWLSESLDGRDGLSCRGGRYRQSEDRRWLGRDMMTASLPLRYIKLGNGDIGNAVYECQFETETYFN